MWGLLYLPCHSHAFHKLINTSTRAEHFLSSLDLRVPQSIGKSSPGRHAEAQLRPELHSSQRPVYSFKSAQMKIDLVLTRICSTHAILERVRITKKKKKKKSLMQEVRENLFLVDFSRHGGANPGPSLLEWLLSGFLCVCVAAQVWSDWIQVCSSWDSCLVKSKVPDNLKAT